MKAADLDDQDVLSKIETVCIENRRWAMSSEVGARFPYAPPKIVAAKLAKLAKRGLVTGCACGCRGDWELTTAGRDLAGIDGAWRPNPLER